MSPKCIRYRDTWVAPNSALYEALVNGQKDLAEKIYRECEKVRAELESK